MSLFEKLGSLFGAEEEEYDYYEDDSYDEPPARRSYEPPVRKTYDDTPARLEPLPRREPPREPLARERERDRENVIHLHGNETIKKLTSQFKIVVIDPKEFNECPRLVDDLKGRRPVIVNLGYIENPATARKIFDFLCGATYALSGDVKRIEDNIYVFLPENVNIQDGNEE